MSTGSKAHFIGIGGYGMGPLARIMLDMGYRVSGSDMKVSERTERMKDLGARVNIGHSSENVPDDTELVVVSAAIPESNPEFIKARGMAIPILTHAEMVGKLLSERFGIGISGAHGKTTTTSMVSTILDRNGLSPTVLIGGEVDEFAGGGRLGASRYFVVEADEAYGRFLEMHPRIAIITNIDDDHLDYYGTFESVFQAFERFVGSLPEDGAAILNIDDPHVEKLRQGYSGRVITYSITGEADIYAVDVVSHEFGSVYGVRSKDGFLGNVRINVPGVHNVSNSLSAIAAGLEVGLSFEGIAAALEGFRGVHRRFELHGTPGDVMIIDDYAHHPAEIQAVLKSAKGGWDRRVIAVFQPQRFTRTQLLMNEFSRAFTDADIAVIADIYYEGTGEEPIPGVSSRRMAELIRDEWDRMGKTGVVIHIPELRSVVDYLESICRSGDLIITMGAGNINIVAKALVQELSRARQDLG